MTGDQSDLAARLRRNLPPWFGANGTPTPILDALLIGLAWAFSGIFDLITFARQQARLATSVGSWLDLTGFSFFGAALPRFHLETDDLYRDRVRREVFRDRNTRAACIALLTELTGSVPFVYEGWYAPVNGGRGSGRFAYSRAGRWGTRGAPARVIFHVPFPQNYGIPKRGGYGSHRASGAAIGGYSGRGGGNFSFVDYGQIVGRGPSRIEILQRLNAIRTDGVEYFVTFTPPPGH
jgi:hypothetical protein